MMNLPALINQVDLMEQQVHTLKTQNDKQRKRLEKEDTIRPGNEMTQSLQRRLAEIENRIESVHSRTAQWRDSANNFKAILKRCQESYI